MKKDCTDDSEFWLRAALVALTPTKTPRPPVINDIMIFREAAGAGAAKDLSYHQGNYFVRQLVQVPRKTFLITSGSYFVDVLINDEVEYLLCESVMECLKAMLF